MMSEDDRKQYAIETPIRIAMCGPKMIGLPPRLDTPEIHEMLERVNEARNWQPADYRNIASLPSLTISAEDATLLHWLFNQQDLVNLF